MTRLDAAIGWPGKAKLSTTTSLFFDGTVTDPANAHYVKDFDHVFQDTNPSIDFEEAYLDVFLPSVDLRIGKQRFSWGKLDAFNPTDVLNPLDYSRPASAFENLSKIGVPALRVDLFPPSHLDELLPEMFSIEGVWIPFAVPYRLPTSEERWFPPLLRISPELTLTAEDLGEEGNDPVLSLGIDLDYHDVTLPSRSLDHGQYAAMVTAHVGRADLAVSYFDGYDRLPTAELTGTVSTTRSGLLSDPPHLDLDLDVRFLLDRVRVAGGGFSVPVWEVTVKGDFAFVHGRMVNFDLTSPEFLIESGAVDIAAITDEFERNFPSQGFAQTIPIGEVPISIERDIVSGALQVEYMTGDWVFDLAVYEDFILDWDSTLINPRVDVRVVLNVRRTFLDEVLTVETPLLVDAATGDVLASPQATYTLYDDLKATAGLLAIWGDDDSLFGQYHDNDQLYARLEFSF